VIERLLIKNHLSFAECDIEFKKGLVVFSGPSGAGLADAVQNPGNPDSYRNSLLEHKVAASIAKKLSKHLVPAE
jgi:recombinational DNA repair ATPase RecF